MKNQKISNSLKKYHHKKRIKQQRKKEIKVILWLIAFTAIIGIYSTNGITKATDASAPYARMQGMLPDNPDKQNLTDKDRVFISASRECKKRGLGDYCINDIMGMANRETRFKCDAVGDFGASHGCLQIHLGFHPHVTQEQARDTDFAVNWTLERMQKYGYPEFRSYAIRKHNGSPTNPKTYEYLLAVNNY